MSTPGTDAAAASAAAVTPSGEYASAEERFHGQKPWFVRKLPSRLEILEGSTFDLYCHVGRGGCKPWFVKPLPSRLEVGWGDDVETKCIVGVESESETGSEVSSSADDVVTVQQKKQVLKKKRQGVPMLESTSL